jgi:hypothetical protein
VPGVLLEVAHGLRKIIVALPRNSRVVPTRQSQAPGPNCSGASDQRVSARDISRVRSPSLRHRRRQLGERGRPRQVC